jgi:hypothetical protein
MPYIATKERPAIDKKVEALAEEISEKLALGANNDTDISVHYRRTLMTIAKVLLQLERGKTTRKSSGRAQSVALEIFGEARDTSTDRGAWLGRFNYALTRFIQVVPEKMVQQGVWKEEFRYWVYAQTVGALSRSAMDIHTFGGDDWPTDGLVGVMVDVKDEYKRRVNAAYEAFQIRKAGDCYNTRYRTELSEVKDVSGKVIGYAEVMKDFGTKA